MINNTKKNISEFPDMPFNERIKFICKLAGSAKKLSEISGVSTTAIDKYKYSNGEPTRPSLIAIARAVDVPIEWLTTGKAPHEVSYNTINVKGFAECGIKGWLKEFDMEQEFTFSISDKDAFAIMSTGRSMIPASIKPGAICIISPNSPINISDIVYVETKENTVALKKLVALEEKWITLQGWLDPDEKGMQHPYIDEINRSYINNVYPVLWIKSKPM